MGRGKHLGELEAMVLAAVVRAGAGAHGTAVYDAIEASTGRDPTLPAVHVTLRRLDEKGLVTSRVGEVSPRGGRPRRHYRLTDEGAERLRECREMWRRVWSGLEIPETGGTP
ncbi:MAG: PadR family transcriptional regulator [Longimicrobiales bacterium]